MNLKELIEKAEKKAGTQKALGEYLGLSPSNLRNAKAGQQGIPNYACVMIAELIGEKQITVIAANELITEKKEERRKVWLPFVRHAASVLLSVALWAVVASNMSPSPAEAAPNHAKSFNTLYIMSNGRLKKLFKLLCSLAGFLRMQPTTWIRPHCYG